MERDLAKLSKALSAASLGDGPVPEPPTEGADSAAPIVETAADVLPARSAETSLGEVVLDLISDWDSWVSRRVDSFAFAGDDERVLARHHSMDFAITEPLRVAAARLPQLLGIPVPVTVVDKWRISGFSLRDETGGAISLFARPESTAITVATLTVLAERVLAASETSSPVPPVIAELIGQIVNGERPKAIRLCATFVESVRLHPLRDDDAEQCAGKLAASPEFMGLAFELARGFVLFARYPSEADGHRLLKMSYNSYVVPATRDSIGVRLAHQCRKVRNRSSDSSETCSWTSSDGALASGRVVFSALADVVPDGPKERGPGLACALVTVSGKEGRRTMRLRPNAAIALEHVPDGTYGVEVVGTSGFEIVGWSRQKLVVENGSTKHLTINARRTNISKGIALAPARIASPATRIRQLSRGLGWYSKPLAIQVRLGNGGSYHCEFQAPEGLHVTRARLVSDVQVPPRTRGREIDVVLSSDQKAHLYAPWDKARPSAGYVFINLRPRVETIARSALLTALIAFATVFLVAVSWNPSTGFVDHGPDDASAILVLLLGAPGALAAYFAQAVPSRVTNSMLYGLRVAALTPGILALACGAVVLTGRHRSWGHAALWIFSFQSWGQVAMWVITLLAAGAAVGLGATAWFAEHPREQRRTDYDQGEGFESTYSLPAARNRANEPEPSVPLPPPVATIRDRIRKDEAKAEAVREEMLSRAAGLSPETRRLLLGQRILWRREIHEIPPALYFDSAETPPTFPNLAATAAKDLGSVVRDEPEQREA